MKTVYLLLLMMAPSAFAATCADLIPGASEVAGTCQGPGVPNEAECNLRTAELFQGYSQGICIFAMPRGGSLGAAPSVGRPSGPSPDLTPIPNATPRVGDKGQLTFIIRNSAQFLVNVALYSQSRNWSWPGTNTHWELKDGVDHTFSISCTIGEHICYGAWYTNLSKWWGASINNSRGCTDCCLHCGSYEQNVTHRWNLTE